MPIRREDASGTLHELGAIYREDSSGTLHEVGAVYREEADGTLTQVYSAAADLPDNLTASFNQSTDAVDLSWDPDPDHSQDVWRCQGSSCDPVASGTKIDTVSAGVGSYSDTGPTCDGGRTFSYQIEDNTDGDESNIESIGEPPCFD